MTRLITPLSLVALLAPSVSAFVPSPVGGRAGQLDVAARVTLERGLIEPNENQASWQDANWEVYTLDAGYSFGDVGGLRDVFARIDVSFFDSPAERVGGQTFAEHDSGVLVGLTAGLNLIHVPDFAWGLFVRGTVPIDVNLDKFANPRVDYLALGSQVGVRLTPHLSYEALLYLGTGPFGPQNATVALQNVFGLEARPSASWKFGTKLGTYFDGDLTERFDDAYDEAFSPGYPDQRDRIRMMRFGLVIAPYIAFDDRYSLEFNAILKLFGFDAPATQVYQATLRVVL